MQYFSVRRGSPKEPMVDRQDKWNQEIIVEIDSSIEELIPRFLQHRRESVTLIANALTTGEYAKIAAIGHDLEGTCGSYGFADLADMGRMIRQAAFEEHSGDVRRIAQEFKNYLDRLKVVFVDESELEQID